MREFPEALAYFNAPAPHLTLAAGAPGWAPPQPAPRTLVFCGYQIGAEPDPRLGGHPDLRY